MTHKIILGDCIEGMRTLANESVHCVVTSPPYFGLRDYGVDGQIGLEESPEEYVAKMVEVFREVRRILRNDGTLWLNLGDSYAGNNSQASNNGRAGYGNPRERIVNRMGEGLKPKDLIGIPWRVAFALQSDGWYLRQDIIWHKPNPMPESVTDRCTKAHEYIFLLSKSERYYYDHEAINEQVVNMGNPRKFRDAKENSDKTMRHDNERLYIPKETRNKRSVWTVATKPYAEAHFATYPTKLIEPCILAGSPVGGVVFDPFTGSGTTALVALTNNRSYIGTELNPEYIRIAENRLSAIQPKMELV
jgi:DNA modification methylase